MQLATWIPQQSAQHMWTALSSTSTSSSSVCHSERITTVYIIHTAKSPQLQSESVSTDSCRGRLRCQRWASFYPYRPPLHPAHITHPASRHTPGLTAHTRPHSTHPASHHTPSITAHTRPQSTHPASRHTPGLTSHTQPHITHPASQHTPGLTSHTRPHSTWWADAAWPCHTVITATYRTVSRSLTDTSQTQCSLSDGSTTATPCCSVAAQCICYTTAPNV